VPDDASASVGFDTALVTLDGPQPPSSAPASTIASARMDERGITA